MTTTPVEEEFDFATGMEGTQEQTKSGAQFRKTEFYNMDDGETIIVRFVSEHAKLPFRIPQRDLTIAVQMHSMVPTRNKPSDWPEKGKWPQTMSAVCRQDRAFKTRYPDCFIDLFMKKGDGKPYTSNGRTFAIACLREEVKENGRVVGLKDATREIAQVDKDGKPTGETVVEKRFIVFVQAQGNFWERLEGYAGRYGTITDRDYQITRKGKDTGTTYQIVALDPVPMLDGEGRPIINNNGQIIGRNLCYKDPGNPDVVATERVDPEWAERYKHDINLPLIVAEQASDEYYARFFDTRVPQPPTKKSGDSSSSSDTPTGPPSPDNDVSSEAMQALMDRVKGHPGADATAAPEQAAQAAPAPQEQAPAQAEPAAAGGMRDFG